LTRKERTLINAVLKWCAADLTPTTHPYHDNYGEGELYDAMQNAAVDVMAERDHGIEHYFSAPPRTTP